MLVCLLYVPFDELLACRPIHTRMGANLKLGFILEERKWQFQFYSSKSKQYKGVALEYLSDNELYTSSTKV